MTTCTVDAIEPRGFGNLTFVDYVRALRRSWGVVVITTLITAAGAQTMSLLQTPLYEARAQVFVSTSGAGDVADLNQGHLYREARQVLHGPGIEPRLLQPVIESLQLPGTAESLAAEVSASSPLDTVLIDITATNPDPTRARDIANAIADTYPKLVAELETPPGESKSPVNVSRTKTATTPLAPVSPKTRLNFLLGLLVGWAWAWAWLCCETLLTRPSRAGSRFRM
ncbi:MAG: hypothetical protein IPG94_20985 [Kineosporiaceae bacterium]|nr:hypothetical protein [Kineosporiaceae bacterium]